MDSGSNMESKAASGDDAGDQEEVAAPPPPAAGDEAAAASSPPAAPAAAASPKPYYECVFCKRGFTTAQALGGHMNIHRRDRAKPAAAGRDSSPAAGFTSVSRNVECYNRYRHLGSSSYHPPPPSSSSTPIPVGAGTSFGMIYVSSGAAAAPTARMDAESGGSPSGVSPRELSLFDEASHDHDDDQDLHLGLGRHGRHVGGGSRTAAEGSGGSESGEPERELDLELRLGRRPRH
nr:unnamed protein product [Digitaria exilis]